MWGSRSNLIYSLPSLNIFFFFYLETKIWDIGYTCATLLGIFMVVCWNVCQLPQRCQCTVCVGGVGRAFPPFRFSILTWWKYYFTTFYFFSSVCLASNGLLGREFAVWCAWPTRSLPVGSWRWRRFDVQVSGKGCLLLLLWHSTSVTSCLSIYVAHYSCQPTHHHHHPHPRTPTLVRWNETCSTAVLHIQLHCIALPLFCQGWCIWIYILYIIGAGSSMNVFYHLFLSLTCLFSFHTCKPHVFGYRSFCTRILPSMFPCVPSNLFPFSIFPFSFSFSFIFLFTGRFFACISSSIYSSVVIQAIRHASRHLLFIWCIHEKRC